MEIKDELLYLGKNEGGEMISKLYVGIVTKTTERTTAIIQMLTINNAQLIDTISRSDRENPFKGKVSVGDIERIMNIKGFKRNEISNILNNL